MTDPVHIELSIADLKHLIWMCHVSECEGMGDDKLIDYLEQTLDENMTPEERQGYESPRG